MLLDRSYVLYDRDDKGELIPKEVPLIVDENNERQKEFKGTTIAITPLTRGELRRVFSDVAKAVDGKEPDMDNDSEIIVTHCKKPAFTAEDTKYIKPALAKAIVDTILFESGVDINLPTKKQAVDEKEDEFAKN
jgi:hypothetical protein